jgi:hypothetical protein
LTTQNIVLLCQLNKSVPLWRVEKPHHWRGRGDF